MSIAENSAAKKQKADRLKQSFGITYEVCHGSSPHADVIAETLVPEKAVNVLHRSKRVTVKVKAFNGDKGNTVTVHIPVEGLRLLLDRFETAEKERALLALLDKE